MFEAAKLFKCAAVAAAVAVRVNVDQSVGGGEAAVTQANE